MINNILIIVNIKSNSHKYSINPDLQKQDHLNL